jgi:DNA topoisomerase-1
LQPLPIAMANRGTALAVSRDERRDYVRSARRVGLHYVDDQGRGFTRRRVGTGFRYFDEHGRVIRAERTLGRIRALAIPPAWTDVWICPSPNGHIQATGRDARGRKQYRYHARFREVRDQTKYERIFDFAAALPALRARVESDLATPGLGRDKLLATVVCLLDRTHLRIGNEEYARLNKSFGLTTLHDRHARVRGSRLTLQFRAKAGIQHSVCVVDRRLAAIVKRSQDLPGEQLFQYVDERGRRRGIGSADVNDYLRQVSGQDFTAKDFRTWAATVHAAIALSTLGAGSTQRESKARLKEALLATARRLGNTPAICRKCYIHPAVCDAYLAGQVLSKLRDASANRSRTGLRPEEKAVLLFLKRLASKRKSA